MSPDATRLIWIDLEMTGLDTRNDVIIEIATLVTDTSLEIVAEGPVIAIHQPDEVLARMDDWNRKTHGSSGLIERVRSSRTSMEEAEARTLAFLRQHVPPGVSPMCGNSICQDRRFLARSMPELEAVFPLPQPGREHPEGAGPALGARGGAQFQQEGPNHQALDDIYESIAELQSLPGAFPADARASARRCRGSGWPVRSLVRLVINDR